VSADAARELEAARTRLMAERNGRRGRR
jgi:hypothetical protein